MTLRMRCFLALGLGLAAACADEGADAVTAAGDPWGKHYELRLPDGKLQGDGTGKSVRFLAVPYAKPPLGALRWQAPVSPLPWSGVRHATDFAEACPQNGSMLASTSTNEDCLYLNVWAPDPKPMNAPVMVWIHGGGNFSGSAGDRVPDPLAGQSAPRWYDGSAFAEKQGVVVVSMNYRLGPFGFFSHPALAAERAPLGNQGLHDQKFALEWVRDNIAAFGGDPGNVTIFGESAGSADVCFHVTSPLSRGLFHRAISESGGCTTSPRGARNQTAADAAAGMRAFALALGCDGDSPLACLRAKSVGDLLANAMQPEPSAGFFAKSAYTFEAVIDGQNGMVPEAPHLLLERGDFAKVPYILGSNNDEGSLFTVLTNIGSEDAYRAQLSAAFGGNAEQIFAMYAPAKFNNDYRAALSRVVGDSSLVCGTHEVGRKAAAAGASVYMYNFNVPWTVGFGTLGVAHSAEIGHVFGTPYQPTGTSQTVSDAMNHYWAEFARSGVPNFAGAPGTWPAFSSTPNGGDQRLQLDDKFAVVDDFRKEECAMWRAIYDAPAAD